MHDRFARGLTRVRLASLTAFVLVFLVASLQADLVISELSYAPRDPGAGGADRPDLQFVEIYNDGPEAYDLSGFFFSRGLTFEFPEGSFIGGRDWVVVAADVEAVEAEYGISEVFGPFRGQLDDAGETVELANAQGLGVTRVPYNDRGQWPSGARGTGHTLALAYEYSDAEDPDSWRLSARVGGTPGRRNFNTRASFEEDTIVPDNAVWRYFKGRSSPPNDWLQPSFDDGGWESGRTGIGYGDGDDRTVLDDMRDSYLTVFCRHSFELSAEERASIDSLVLRVTYDDGFFAYLNGTEIGSANVSGRDFDDEANGAGEPETVDIVVATNLLRNGDNLLAVQVHNGNLDSSDLSFIPQLVSRREVSPEESIDSPLFLNEAHLRTSDPRFIELYNGGEEAIDLGGFHLTDDYTDLTKHRIADGRVIPARGFLVFEEGELGWDLRVELEGERIELALVDRAGERVIDARIFAPALEDRSEARLPDGDENFAPAARPTPGAPNATDAESDVVFNELMYNPISGNDRDEYIEFFNRGDTTVDLGGWTIDGVGYEFAPGTSIGAGAYLVVANDPRRLRQIYGLSEEVAPDPGYEGRLSNGGERLRLLDEDGNVASQVRYYDGGEWTLWADGGGSSLERIDAFAPASHAGSWDASDDSDKAETEVISYNASHGGGESDLGMLLLEEGITIVDDVAITRGGSNVVSNGTFDSNTSSWRIEGTHSRSGRTSAAAERITGNGSLKLICWNGGGDYKVNRIECNTGTQGGSMRVGYRARWVVGSPTILVIGDYADPANAGIARSHRLNVPNDLGTPGAVNSVVVRQISRFGAANVGPSIDKVAHDPGVPPGGQAVTVRFRARDPDGVARISLRYRLDDPSGAFSSVAVTGPDADGRYEATVPGQASGTRVLFFIEAEDPGGRVSRFPRDVLAGTHPPVIDAGSATPTDSLYCLYRHDNPEPSTSYHNYRFVLDEDSENELRGRRVLSNQTLEGTFIFGSEDVYYNAQIRFAGSPWLRPSGGSFEKSYKIEMPKDDPLHGRHRVFNLDEHGTDGRERLAHYLLRRNAGDTPLPYYDRQSLVRFQLNDVETGTYEALGKPNGEYIQFWFPRDESLGDLYEMDDRFRFNDSGSRTGNWEGKVLYPPYGSTSGGSNKENFRWYFAVRSGKGDDDFAPLQQFAQIMDQRLTPNSQFDSTIFSTMDVEEVLRVWAIELNIDDWDTWGGNRGKNCYLYRSSFDGLWRLVPWDLELTFGNVNAFAMPSSFRSNYGNHFSEITRMINRPRVKRLFYAILAEQVDDFFFTGANSPLSRWANELSGSGVGFGGSLGFVNTRGNSIRSWIRSAIYPQERLEISGDSQRQAEGTSISLEGTAPVDVWSLVVVRNGEALDPPPRFTFSSSNVLGWSLRAPLTDGRNEIEVLGFNREGELIDQDMVIVTNEAPWGRPVITSITPDRVAIGDVVTIVGEEFHEGVEVIFQGVFLSSSVEFDEGQDATTIRAVVPEGLVGDFLPIEVRNTDDQRSDPFLILLGEPIEGEVFVRGDANLDEVVDISDAVATLGYLFLGGTALCIDALDTNDNGEADLTDAIVTLSFLFQGGPAPEAPFPGAGSDPSEDPLDCATGL